MPEFIGEKGMILELSLLAIQVRSSQSLPLSDSPLNDKLAAAISATLLLILRLYFSYLEVQDIQANSGGPK